MCPERTSDGKEKRKKRKKESKRKKKVDATEPAGTAINVKTRNGVLDRGTVGR